MSCWGLYATSKPDGYELTSEVGRAKATTPRTRRVLAMLAASTTTAVVFLMAVNVAASVAGPPSGNWTQTLNEEFSSNGVNTALWTPEWPSGAMEGECTSSNLVSQPGNGYLSLELQAKESTCGGTKYPDTGSLIESNPADGKPGHTGFELTYGYVEWRAYLVGVSPKGRKCPTGGCLPDWPALWSHSNTNADEIDTMEGLETLGEACYHIHPPPSPEAPGRCLSGISYNGWHTYASEWEPGVVKFFYDGEQVGELSSEQLNGTPQYLIADMVAPGSGCCGQPQAFPDEMKIDYVKVWQKLPIVTTSAATGKQPLQATLNGTANSNGTSLSNCHFEYGTSTSYGSSAPCSGPESGESATVSLTPGTTYHFRIVATNASGTAYGSDETLATPGPVEAVTGAATGLLETRATLNGTVNPRGYAAKYYYQYGGTTAYGLSTPEGSAGEGGTAVQVPATLTGLEPGMLYHYRLIGTSGGITSYGPDETFITLNAQSSSRWASLAPSSSDDQWAYFVSDEGRACYWQLVGSWVDNCLGTGNYVAKGSGLSALRDPASGDLWAYFVSTEGRACYWQLVESWAANCLGTGDYVAPNTTLSGVRDPTSGDQWAYFVSTEGRACYWQLVGSWADNCLGTGDYVAKNTGVNTVRDPTSGDQWAYFVSTEGRACYWQLVESWAANCLGTGNYVVPNSELSVVRDGASGDQWVYFVSTEGRACYWQLVGSWTANCLGSGNYVAPNTSLSVVRDPATGNQWVYFLSDEGRVCYWGLNGSSGSWTANCLGSTTEYVAKGSGLAPLRDPETGNQWVYFISNVNRVCYWSLNGSSGSWADNCLGTGEYVAPGST